MRRQRIFEDWQQGSAEPFVSRDIEPGFLPVQDSIRQFPLHGSTEDDLLCAAIQLQTLGEPGGEFHDPMVEQRRTDFEGVRHTHPVDLVKQVVLQVELLIEQKITVQETDIAGRWQIRGERR